MYFTAWIDPTVWMADLGDASDDWVSEDEEEIVVKLSGANPDELTSRLSNASQPKCSYMASGSWHVIRRTYSIYSQLNNNLA